MGGVWRALAVTLAMGLAIYLICEAVFLRRRTPLLLKLGLATMVITDCQAIRSKVMDRFHLPADRVTAVPLAASENFRPVDAPSTDPYFLFVGTLEPRKNIPFLIEAWRRLRAEFPVKLVLVGRRRADAPQIAPQAGLEIKGEVNDSELPGQSINAKPNRGALSGCVCLRFS